MMIFFIIAAIAWALTGSFVAGLGWALIVFFVVGVIAAVFD